MYRGGGNRTTMDMSNAGILRPGSSSIVRCSSDCVPPEALQRGRVSSFIKHTHPGHKISSSGGQTSSNVHYDLRIGFTKLSSLPELTQAASSQFSRQSPSPHNTIVSPAQQHEQAAMLFPSTSCLQSNALQERDAACNLSWCTTPQAVSTPSPSCRQPHLHLHWLASYTVSAPSLLVTFCQEF